MEIHLARVSVRREEDTTEVLWRTRVSTNTVSDLNQKVYGTNEEWGNRPRTGNFSLFSGWYLVEAHMGRPRGNRPPEILRIFVCPLTKSVDKHPLGAPEPRYPPSHAGCGELPRWAVGFDAGLHAAATCGYDQVGNNTLSAHGRGCGIDTVPFVTTGHAPTATPQQRASA